MAKGNMLLGQARGKVGSLVFSRADGKQIVRTRAEVVKNPRTRKQGIQRIIMNTASQVYSHLKDICDHSFEGVQYGQPSMTFFMQKALKEIRRRVAEVGGQYDDFYSFVPVGETFMPLQPMAISKGSLRSIYAKVPSVESGLAGELVLCATPTITTESAITDLTYQNVIDALKAQRGDQITIIAFSKDDADGENLVRHISRIVLDPENTDGTKALLSVPFFTAQGDINLPNANNDVDPALNLEFKRDDNDNFQLVAYVAIGSSYRSIMIGSAIKSRQNADGSWLRSSEILHYSKASWTTFPNSTLGDALTDYLSSDNINAVSDRYLNNATD